MELSDENVQGLARHLALTLSPDAGVRRPAERFLEGVERSPNYGLLMLRLIGDARVDATVRTAGAIAFKNYARRNWHDEAVAAEAERALVRERLVELMLAAPPAIQKQLSDAVAIVGKCDFPQRWPGLIAQMVAQFRLTEDFRVIEGALQTAHSLFKRYRYEFKSEELWREIKFVLDNFAAPLTQLFLGTLRLRETHAGNAEALRVIYSSLLLICKVFHSLNAQDLPEYFEDNMELWMPNLLSLLQVKVPVLNSDDDEPGIVEKVREAAIECGGLYALKYSEEFAPHAPRFVTAAWEALVDAGPEPKYDALVSAALSFLSNVAEKKQYRYLFEDPNTLSQICEKVIIPNMEFRELDQELFEDNPEEYIRRDIEGSDVETRRRAACDLVKVLSMNFEERIFQIFGQYVQVMLARSAAAADGSQWKCKDVALFLVTSMSERGRTARTGVTAASNFVNLPSFFQDHVLPDLNSDNINSVPVLKADAIKYIITFRSLLPKQQILALIPFLIRYLGADSAVVASYSANCIEKIIPIVGNAPELVPLAPGILQALLQLLEKPGHMENDYAMKCVMRTLMSLQGACLPMMGNALTLFSKTLTLISKNPSRPNFNHYLFECISLSIKIVCKANPEAIVSFEDVFFPIFQEILQQEVQEFMPYVFQLLSLLVEQRCAMANAGLSDNSPYLALVSCLLTPALWDRPANIKALVRLLSALIFAGHEALIRDNRLNGMLGVFQKLIASKANDQDGFTLIQSMLQHIPEETMRPFLKQIVSLMFQRLSSSKTTKYIRGLIVFLGFYCLRFGPDNLIETLDSTQAGLFSMYCERILIPEMQKISGPIDIKMTVVGYTKLLCECAPMYKPTGKYVNLWPPIMQALIGLFELPSDETTCLEDQLIDITEENAYQPAYCQLISARQDAPDILKNISEPRQYLSQSLGNLAASQPGILPTLVERLSADHRNVLNVYLQKFGVRIV